MKYHQRISFKNRVKTDFEVGDDQNFGKANILFFPRASVTESGQ